MLSHQIRWALLVREAQSINRLWHVYTSTSGDDFCKERYRASHSELAADDSAASKRVGREISIGRQTAQKEKLI